MARLPRLTVPGCPHHVLQRGNNRQPVFLDDEDRHVFLALLAEHAAALRVEVHAYVLMDNHFHLLATPPDATALGRLIQAVGRRYVRHFNDRHHRSGTLWEGRYRSAPLQADRYLLPCMVYLDLNPVRAGRVADAREYLWSSHAHYVGVRSDRLVTPHTLYWALGNTPFAREAAYADRVRVGLDARQQGDLVRCVLGGWALGSETFVAELQKNATRRVSKGRPGRPRASPLGAT